MRWKKSSEAAVKRFDALVAVPGAERGLLFGCPFYRLGAERYATLYEERFVLRLSAEDGAALLAKGGKPFEPLKGRKAKGRFVVPESISKTDRALRPWIDKALKYAAGA